MPPTIDQMWLWILAAATPIAGLVGFALSLWQLKRARLENEKLRLEVEALRAAQAAKEQRVVLATLDEVKEYGHWPRIRNYQESIHDSRVPVGLVVVIIVVLMMLLYWLLK